MKTVLRVGKFFLTVFTAMTLLSAGAWAQEAVPQRIVSLNLCTDELILHLAEKERIAAVTHLAHNPDATAFYEKAKGIPKIKGRLEEVLAFKPDLVIAGTFTHQETLAYFEHFEIPTVILRVADDFEGVYRNIEIVSKAIGEEKKGEMLIAKMKDDLSQIPKTSSKNSKAIFYQSRGNTPGEGTFQDDILKLLGVENISAARGIVGHGYLSLEELMTEKPDYVIFLNEQRDRASMASELLFHPALKKGLQGIETVTLPSRLLTCGSPALVEATRMLSEKMQ